MPWCKSENHLQCHDHVVAWSHWRKQRRKRVCTTETFSQKNRQDPLDHLLICLGVHRKRASLRRRATLRFFRLRTISCDDEPVEGGWREKCQRCEGAASKLSVQGVTFRRWLAVSRIRTGMMFLCWASSWVCSFISSSKINKIHGLGLRTSVVFFPNVGVVEEGDTQLPPKQSCSSIATSVQVPF